MQVFIFESIVTLKFHCLGQGIPKHQIPVNKVDIKRAP